ncbi:sigma-54-dependent transcriptional regulator [Gaopeijia maritima]|uniref:Sigma-54 dependent transcriptional regulator n=1 Tax=Gaopeijia maritima TaxID=3119007 RepID=A0ABU9EDE6_9BACT
MNGRILVVDDEEGLREALAEKLRHSGHAVETAASAEEALAGLSRIRPDLIVTDLMMPGLTGLELLEKVQESLPSVGVVVMTGNEDMASAVAAMKAGAFDYLVKPVRLAQVDELVVRCLREQALNREAEAAPEPTDTGSGGKVVGRDPRMIEIYKMIGVLARNRATVMIRGETGTGKEMVARAIHTNSAHADEPFVAVNCTALSETLLESELFGHVKGSFTGAVSARRGYFEMAGSGTIFLDEIGDTSPEFQTKLLRVLQERTFYPVGGESPKRTEARIIAATHQPMELLVEEGSFREDLYFRLRVVEIEVPPLRERRDDIPRLAEALLERIRTATGSKARHIGPAAMRRLLAHDWPGNVRELENALTRAAVLARGAAIDEEHLVLGLDSDADGVTGGARASGRDDPDDLSLDSAIRRHVQVVLHRTDGNKSETARVLGISRSRLQRYVDRFDLHVPS